MSLQYFRSSKIKIKKITLKLINILKKADNVIKKYLYIKDDQIPFVIIDKNFECESSDRGKLNFNFTNENFRKITNKEYLADVLIFFSVFYEDSGVIAYAFDCFHEKTLLNKGRS